MKRLVVLVLVTLAGTGCASGGSSSSASSDGRTAASPVTSTPSTSASASTTTATTETAMTDTGVDTGPAPGSLGQDSFGDPYITDAQGRTIHKGMSASAAFNALGGKADSGSTGQQAGPVLGYDYPIKGTGNPDDPNDSSTIWWQICIGDGRVLSTQRGTMDNLPAFCPS